MPQGATRHENDVFVEGYSDQLLRFIAERGDEGQLGHVERIDQAYKLGVAPGGLDAGRPRLVMLRDKDGPETPLPLVNLTPRSVAADTPIPGQCPETPLPLVSGQRPPTLISTRRPPCPWSVQSYMHIYL